MKDRGEMKVNHAAEKEKVACQKSHRNERKEKAKDGMRKKGGRDVPRDTTWFAVRKDEWINMKVIMHHEQRTGHSCAEAGKMKREEGSMQRRV